MLIIHVLSPWLLRSAFICFLLQALTGALLTLHYEPSLRPAMTENGKPIVMLEMMQPLRHKPTQTRYNAHDILFAEYDTAAKAPFYAPDTLRVLTRILAHSHSAILPSAAYYSVEHGIMRSADFGVVVRGIHASSANLTILIFVLWLGAGIVSGIYAQMLIRSWLTGIVLFALTFGTSIVGYILPMNVRSLTALTILLSTLESKPLLGKWLAGIVRGASTISSPTLVRIYALHILLVPTVLAACWYALRRQVVKREEWAQFLIVGVGILWLCVVMACVLTPASQTVLRVPADFTAVFSAPQNAQPEWYALGVAALMKILPAWSVVAGLLVWLLATAALPFVEKRSARIAAILRVTVGIFFMGICTLTLWQVQWYELPALALSEENLEIIVVVSILSGILAGALVAWLGQKAQQKA